ncbi:MAG: radical SAM family heme chaperone HemW [Agathobacter sp.]|nr:radical SAM family heme chaperone HemW [Agathobacter sp.]
MKNLELYIHIPFCVKKCAYCDFLSFSCDKEIQLAYADALIREIEFYGPKMKGFLISTIFIGGGTPTSLDEEKMLEILDAIYTYFQVSADAEVTMECNPGTVSLEKLQKYRKAGVNRLSIGLQSADDEELELLGRIHNYEEFVQNFQMAKQAGFYNVNIDLISGIPYQTAEKFLHTLQKIVRLKPNHISVYSLIIEKGTPFYETYKFDLVKQEAGMKTDILPTEDEVYRTIKLTQQFLAQSGYEQYEISNFAQPGYACDHNIGYWTRENYLGLGLGAASLVDNVRYTNMTDLNEYIKQSKQIKMVSFEQPSGEIELGTNLHIAADVVNRKAQMEEFMFLGLRMNCGVTRAKFEECFGIPIEGIYGMTLDTLKKQGLVKMSAGTITLTEKGQDLSNYVLAQFLL